MAELVSLSEEDQALAAGFVLGDLSPEEAQYFQQRLRQNSVLLKEVHALHASLRLLPQSLPVVSPPPELLDKILLANPEEERSTESNRLTQPSFSQPLSIWWGKIITGVAVLAALLLGADNLRLRQSLSAATQVDTETVATILQRPKSRLIALAGEQGSAAVGTLLFTPGQWQDVIISIKDLPPLPPDQVYRMWLSLNTGQVIPCGEFKTNVQGSVFIELNPAENPPQGTKATGVFVTVDRTSAPLSPQGDRILGGNI